MLFSNSALPDAVLMAGLRVSPSRDRLLFGLRVREERRRQGLTLEELGERTSLVWNYIASVERGERNITMDNASVLAKGLGLPLWTLLQDSSEVYPKDSP
ncbi:helix-turn-helix domain-containing protein [Deinococcus sp. QL22]|uniref:helix-turn-helix domain-containing protein n=1 Tax=Deinococcus sp. QL22 TaxID=2939437 RepID=UPI002017A740|nr:helix-turn-helix transcriptional regulator [Deinococcus sp. QL22]UQN10221.1 helix-turn-helix domain-containing protein [Deinococcus sp. QL22]